MLVYGIDSSFNHTSGSSSNPSCDPSLFLLCTLQLAVQLSGLNSGALSVAERIQKLESLVHSMTLQLASGTGGQRLVRVMVQGIEYLTPAIGDLLGEQVRLRGQSSAEVLCGCCQTFAHTRLCWCGLQQRWID